jgi:hypothetical protein
MLLMVRVANVAWEGNQQGETGLFCAIAHRPYAPSQVASCTQGRREQVSAGAPAGELAPARYRVPDSGGRRRARVGHLRSR